MDYSKILRDLKEKEKRQDEALQATKQHIAAIEELAQAKPKTPAGR